MTTMGLHMNSDLGADLAVSYCDRVKPGMMKWLAPNKDVIAECRRRSPDTLHIGRYYWQDQKLSNYGEFQNRVLSWSAGQGLDYVEGYNEFGGHGTTDDEWDAFARLEVGLAKRLNARGIGAAIGGFSTGFLDEGRKLTAFRAAFDYMQHAGHEKCILHAHEYAAPYMQYMVQTPDGKNQWNHQSSTFTGVSAEGIWDPNVEGWLTLRYRKLRRLLLAEGYDRVRMVISESGIDDVNPRPGGANKKGWRDYHNTEWSRYPGIGDFAEQMRWYAWQLSQDTDFILGFCDFGFGTRDPAWASFDLSQTPTMLERLILRQLEVPGPVPIPVPAPEPVPISPPSFPPRLTAALEVTSKPAPGEGWAAFAARCRGYGAEPVPWATRLAWATEIKATNGLSNNAELAATRSYRMPAAWFKAEAVT